MQVTKEMREFVHQARVLKDVWLNSPEAKTTEEKMDGLLFSLLNMLDERYHVIPLPEQGELLVITDATAYINNSDIAGCLHEIYSSEK